MNKLMNKLSNQNGWFWFFIGLAAFNLWPPFNVIGLVAAGFCIVCAINHWE